MSGNKGIFIGYCSGCRMPVELTDRLRCPLHPIRGMTDIQEATIMDVDRVKTYVILARSRRIRGQLIAWLIGLIVLLLLGYAVIFLVEF